MKLSILSVLLVPAAAFSVVNHVAPPQQQRTSLTTRHMFGGAGAGAPTEDNPEQEEQMKKAAATMGMSLDEYKVAMNARVQLAKEMDTTMVTAGNADKVQIERDVNNPPKTMKITITEEGKALGKENLSKELVKSLKAASEASKNGR
jgi:hypothetical protein